jgi:hypothetical protein
MMEAADIQRLLDTLDVEIHRHHRKAAPRRRQPSIRKTKKEQSRNRYLDALMKFQDWCEQKRSPFKYEMMLAMESRMNEDKDVRPDCTT